MKTIEQKIRASFRRAFPWVRPNKKRVEFFSDGVGVRDRNLSHLADPAFVEAWEFAVDGNRGSWPGKVPDIRWRAHTCCWAAKHALTLDGDFVECGVNAGLLSMTVCRYLGFGARNRRFYLYDTFEGIPTDGLTDSEMESAEQKNVSLYRDCFAMARRNFAPFPNAVLVRGKLPGSIGTEPQHIAYLSIDLNSETFERQTIDVLWPRLVSGAIVVIDDYGFSGHERQFAMWNSFATQHGTAILMMPTGQGLLIKPPHQRNSAQYPGFSLNL